MSAIVEARRLSGADIGKTVEADFPGGRYTGPRRLQGMLMTVMHSRDWTELVISRDYGGPPRAHSSQPIP